MEPEGTGPDHDTPASTASGGCPPGNCSCGAPGRASFLALDAPARAGAEPSASGVHTIEQVQGPAGTFTMGDSSGDENPGDGELPLHEVRLDAFAIDATSVTNADFARFVDATGYRTEAENWGFSAVFHLAVQAPRGDLRGPASGTPWWFGVRGADWAHPGGRESTIEGLEDHPVVHVSWTDAVAYCDWSGRRLPTEAE